MKKILIFGLLIVAMALQAQQYNYRQDFNVDFDNGPQSNYQWYLDVFEAQDAWEITRGTPEISIAYVCASGVNWLHEDLGDNGDGFDNIHRTGTGNLEQWDVWNIPDNENTDDDGNGYADDWRGMLFLGAPQEPTNNTLVQNPYVFHSTWVTGIMSAKNIGNDGIFGIAGGDQNSMGNSLIISGYNYYNHLWDDISTSINYAVENGARVILLDASVSHAVSTYGNIDEALENAFEAGCFVVAPSGWDGSNILWYPSSYGNYYYNGSIYSVFLVGASTEPDNDSHEYRHSSSSYGMGFNSPPGQPTFTELDLVAPGEHLYTTSDVTDEYRYIKGSGPAAAMVASTVGLMLSVNPELTYNEIETILHETAEKIGQDDYYTYGANGWNEYVGYGRLNTYAAVCAALETAPPIEVVDGDTWDQPVFSLNDIVLPENYTLTVTSNVFFGSEASFIVKPGATLILDGGTLTNYKFCGNEDLLWKGVEVWGDPTQHQYSTSGSCAQGKIVLRNGAVIENAEIGVLLAARDDNSEGDFMNGGGIIEISNNSDPNIQTAIFRNNKQSVYFYSYHNFLPNDPYKKEVANLSVIENCSFEVNADYLEGSWAYSQIYLFDISGLRIRGCTFENTNTVEASGHGVNAYHAGFKVEAICNATQSPCPDEYLDKNTFSNFYKGINLVNGGIYTLTTEHTDFSGNTTGIMLSNVNNATVLFSHFNIGANAADAGQCDSEGKVASGYGIDMEGCTGFAIEENNFAPASSGEEYTGIRCKDSHTRYDIIYNNTFDGLSYGNFAEGMNRYNAGDDWDGLEYQCNYNSNNNVDFQVEDLTDPLNAKIRGYLGYTNISAGNTFSQQSGVQWHFLNLGKQQIDYWWYEGNPTEEPEYYCNFGPNPYPDPCYFTPYGITLENTCPSHYGGGSGGSGEKSVSLTPEQFQETEQEYFDALNNYNNVKSLFDNLQDGGNTQMLKSEVETAFPSDMWQLRSELLGVSPHVSKDVLMTTAEKTDVFPESVLFEILSANPDELKNWDMISFLENKEDPLPDYMIEILKQIAGGVTYKTILKRQMADFHARKSQAANDIIRDILADTVVDMQLYRNWLDNIGSIEADKQIIASYIQEGAYISAQTLLDLIPSLYEFIGDELTQYNDYMSLTEFQINLEQQNRNIFELDSLEIDFLVNLADNSGGTARTFARGILNFGYGYDYCNCLRADSSTMKSSAIGFDKPETDNGLYIAAKPNPADTWVAFDYKLPSYIEEAVLTITDIEGREITSFYIDGQDGQKIWDARKIESGAYFYALEAGSIRKSGKLIIK